MHPSPPDPPARPVRRVAAGVAGSVLAALLASPGAAQERAIRVPVEDFTLPNGLRVILHRDTTSPIIATNIWYHVGSAHERPARTGFAHLFEHIMFEGSKNVPEGAIDEWFEEVGGSPNGSTSNDRTNYMQTFSRNALEMALFIESDRMGWLLDAMSPASVDGQRDVVKNERRQSYDNRPYGLVSQVISEHLYPSDHPYYWPVIGYMDDLSAASYEDVVDFFRRYYAPNNASLVVAGDFDTAEARRLVEKWFGGIPRGEPVPALDAAPPERTRPELLVLEDRVQLPRVYLTWVTPRAFAEDDAALTAAAEVLAAGKNSRLFQRLVYELQVADNVSARQGSSLLAAEFTIAATARAGHTLEEIEALIRTEVERLAAEGPSENELRRFVNQFEAGFLERLERIDAKADQLNRYAFYVGTPDSFAMDLERFRRLTPGDVAAAVRRWLDRERAVVLSVVPLGRTELAVPGSARVARDNLDRSPTAR